MSNKNSKIRITQKDKEVARKTVASYNSKLRRALKKDPSLAGYLPPKKSVKDVLAIKSRKDFNKEIASMRRILKKGSLDKIQSASGMQTTKYEYREYGYKLRSVNAKRKKERKLAVNNYEKGVIGADRLNNLRPLKMSKNKSKWAWEKFKKTLEAQSKDDYLSDKMEKYKETYLKALYENVYEAENYDKLIKLIESMTAEDLYYNYYSEAEVQIGYISDPLNGNTIVDSMLSAWSRLGFNFEEDEEEEVVVDSSSKQTTKKKSRVMAKNKSKRR